MVTPPGEFTNTKFIPLEQHTSDSGATQHITGGEFALELGTDHSENAVPRKKLIVQFGCISESRNCVN